MMMTGGSSFPLLSSLIIQNEIYETKIEKKPVRYRGPVQTPSLLMHTQIAQPPDQHEYFKWLRWPFIRHHCLFFSNRKYIYRSCVNTGTRSPKSEIELFGTSTGTIFDEFEVINILLLREKIYRK